MLPKFPACCHALLTVLGLLALGRPAAAAPTPVGNTTLSNTTLTLVEAQQTAVQSSPLLREYRARSKEARFKVDEVYTQAAPTVGIGGNFTYLEPPLALKLGSAQFVGIAESNYDVTASLKQAIYTFGRLRWGAADAELQEKASKADLTYREALVLENITVAYYQASEACEQLRIAQDNYTARKGHLADAESLYEAGTTAAYDVKRDESAFATAEQQLLEAQNQKELALVQLYILMGQPRDARLPEQNAALLEKPPERLPIDKVIETRQDLQSQRWAQQAAAARVRLARSGDSPRFDLETDYSRRNALTIQPPQLWATWIQLSLPIFDGGLTQAKVGQANQVVEELGAQYENSVRQVRLEVESYYLELVNRWKKIQADQRAVDAADEAARISVLRYQNGLASNLEVLDAQAALTQARQDLVTARFDYLVSWAHFRRAGGQ